MERTRLCALCGLDFTLSEIAVMYQYWHDGGTYSFMRDGRSSYGLKCLSHVSERYRMPDGREIVARRGDVVLVSRASCYRVTFSDCPETGPADMLVNFQMTDAQGRFLQLEDDVIVLHPARPQAAELQFAALMKTFYAASPLPGELKSLLYHLLVSLSLEQQQRMMDKRFLPVARGIRFLEDHWNEEVSVRELAAQCSVSESCFRKLFKAYAGMSPVQYRLQRKLELAASLLRYDYASVSDAAHAVGIEDAAYFSRVFTQKMGVNPSAFGQTKTSL